MTLWMGVHFMYLVKKFRKPNAGLHFGAGFCIRVGWP